MREKQTVYTRDYYGADYEEVVLPVVTKEELLTVHPRYLVKQRPIGVSYLDDDFHVGLVLPESFKFNDETPGRWVAVKISVFKEVLNSMPHIPNKKEAKAIRKAKIKQGR